jgi:ABC-type nitrate/sulfonate/bicarbonate transport system substrate-binding protein
MKQIIISLVFLLWTHHLGAAERIRIGYSSISGAYIPIWVAHDGGYFAKEVWKTKSCLSRAALSWRK